MTRSEFIKHVESTQRPLRRFLVALCCGDTALADDIAQDSYVKAYLALDSFRSDSSFSTWLYRIAYNVFLSHRRSLRPTVELGGEACSEAAPDTADSGFRYQALYRALAALSDKERQAILLHYLEGYSVKEVAEMSDLSQDAVRQQLSRGRSHLKNFLNSPGL